jgi:prephenate dehydrogenase
VSHPEKIQTIAIIGVGLIGGSFALALREAGFSGEIVGVSSPPAIQVGIDYGAISRGVSLEEAAASADLLYLAQPVDRILETIEVLGRIVTRNSLITDGGSTKSVIVKKASEHLGSAAFLGGHPMAGKEQRGVEAADAQLFRDRTYILCPPATAVSPFEADFRSWLTRIGATVLEMPADEHDATVAFTSHLPQLLSTALADTLAKCNNPHLQSVFGGGLIDMTRLALSSADLWESILGTNKAAVADALDEFVKTLAGIRQAIGSDELREYFTRASAYSCELRKPPLKS